MGPFWKESSVKCPETSLTAAHGCQLGKKLPIVICKYTLIFFLFHFTVRDIYERDAKHYLIC